MPNKVHAVAQFVGVTGVFHWLNPSGCPMALGFDSAYNKGSLQILCQKDTPVIVGWFASSRWKNNTK